MAFPLTTEAALCSCFRILLQDLAPILRSKELLRFWELGPELKIFQKKISRIQDLLNNAEERSQLEICVREWMDDVRELSYEMENLVDEMNRKRVWMDQHVAILNQARTSPDAAHKYSYWDIKEPQVKTIKEGIDDASKRLDEVLKGAKDLKLKPQVVGKNPVSSVASRVEEDVGASVDNSDVCGRQKDQDLIIQEYLMSSSNKNYSTVSIVGMGGVGKTTLARLIFHDERIKKNFDVRSWACVSDVFNAGKVLKQLIEYVPGDSVSTTAPLALRPRFEDMVKGKKILIVLDDVWEVKAWDSLKVSFTRCAEGSKILVTTRDKSIGDEGDEESYELKPLDDEDCWHLFKKKAFGKEIDENLEKIGREIVKKCKGVPLAVKVMGSTLRGASPGRWESALRNELWKVEPMARDEIFPALKLSYHYLPSPLKRCFGYLSLFPTDYELEQGKVVRLWIAEGFIEFGEGRSWEDIGDEYYKELQRRCLIQEDERMHDLIHSLACSVSGKFSYRMENGNDSCLESVRHLSVIDGNMDLEALDENKHLRTLFLFSGHFSEMICDQSLLRVLYLEITTSQELPISVGRLKCLRYLDLSQNKNIEYLPDSICELQSLQTLDLEHCYDFKSLPNDIGDLQKLRYLCLSSTSLSDLPVSIVKLYDLLVLDLNDCQDLSSIPEDIGNLVSLRELYLQGASISSLPDSICRLKKLRVLNLHNCYSFSNLPDEIGALQDLMELNLWGTSISHLPKSIGNLHNLRKLNLRGTSISHLPKSIGNLYNLRKLNLCGTSISHLPKSIGNLHNLRKLNLCWTSISHLPKSIGNLHNLRYLNIDDCVKLAQLPEDICNLSSLESFEFDQNLIRRLPRGIGGLHSIKRLDEFVVGKEEGWGIEELKGMNKLKGSLTISHLENVESVGKARMASLKSKIYIDDLYFKWSSADDSSDVGGVGLTTRDGEMEANVLEALEPYPTDLVTLSLKNYHGERVPMWMAELRFPSLKKLILDGLQCVERVMDVELPSLNYLLIENCPKLRVVSMAVPNLKNFYVSSCQELTTLCMIPSLQEIRSLQSIDIINCPQLGPFIEKGLPPMLRVLKVESCTNLRHLPRDLGHNTSLSLLTIEDCPELVSFPEEGFPPMLRQLEIASCTNLQHLPRALQHNTSLSWLTIKDCPEMVSFPEEGLPPMLRVLKVKSCTNLRHLPRDLGHNTSLSWLTIKDCPELVSFPEEGLPPMLEDLKIASCTNLQHLPRGLQHNTSLRLLTIKDCPEMVSFPEEGLPPMLQKLEIESCTNLQHLPRGLPPMLRLLSIINCTNLRHLPTCLRDLTSLRFLTLDSCPVLGIRSDDQLPPGVRPWIINCSKLEQQLKDEDRKDWLEIASFES